MNLYALLIGINEYASKPLTQCVADVGKVEAYLHSVKHNFSKSEIKIVLNKEASRKYIIEQITTFFAEATDDDVAMVYYSGHGAQEESGGVFPEEQDGLLECMVCYSSDEIGTNQLLADKELQYLLSKLKTNPHLITIFDSCHSGDIVRAFHADDDAHGTIKRIAGVFEARSYSSFIFAGDKEVETVNAEKLHTVNIPFKNHVHLAACLSSESSWEDSKGGVFTRYLLGLLASTESKLTYLDIARWAKISLKTVTKKNQTPTITKQGEGKMDANCSWLNLYPKGAAFPEGFVKNNVNFGWIYTRGSLLGIQAGMNVIITLENDQEVVVKIKEVDLDQAVLDVPMEIINKLDFNRPYYPARTEISTYSGLRLYINDIDDDQITIESLKTILSTTQKVKIVPENDADFYLNVFNGMIYFSLPEHEFQPLAEQIFIHENDELEQKLKAQLKAFIKWQHFYSLDNPGKDFETSPIQVKVINESGRPIDITNGTHRLIPNDTRLPSGELYKTMQIIITNTSSEKLFVGVLTLGSDLSITSKPFDNIVVELPPGVSKTFYDHNKKKEVYVTLDNYKEVYNWKKEWFYYKFIYNNFEDFTSSLNTKDFLQPSLEPPLTIPNIKRNVEKIARGEGGEVEEAQKKWGTCRTRIELSNSSFNIISGDLKELAEEYAKSPKLSPFIKELYFEEYFNGKSIELKLKQNKDQSAEEANRASDSIIVKFLNYIYKTARRRKFLHQKHSTGPIVVAEGDSWFLYPKPGVRDTLDYIMKEYRLLSLAEAGDEIADYIKNNELLTAVKEYKPKYILISGGGNDVLGSEIKTILKYNVQDGTEALDFIDQNKFHAKMNFLSDGYKMFFNEIIKLQPHVTIFVHGYDYIRSNPDEKTIKKGWANKYMIEAGILQHVLRKKIIIYLVDTFNDILKELSKQYPQVQYINNRTTVFENEWMDEIHPNNTGYQKVANNFLALMD